MKLKDKIKKIKLLLLDVDGVLTRGDIIYNDKGIESKIFNVEDGHGIKLLKRAGIDIGIITGRESNVVNVRAKELGITIIVQKSRNKLEAFYKILEENKLTPEDVAYCGDDVVDIPVLKRAGVSFSVKNACQECKNIVDYITEKKGGEGAVREIVELILKLSGKWKEVFKRYEI